MDSAVRLTWSSLKKWVERLALGLLHTGLKKDDMVVIQLPNSVELFALRLACEAAGLLCLPVLRTYRQKELEYILDYTQASTIVIPWRYRDFDYLKMVEELRHRTPALRQTIIGGPECPPGLLSVQGMVTSPVPQASRLCGPLSSSLTAYPSGYLNQTKCPATEFSLVLLTSGTTGLPKFVENPVCAIMLRDRVIMEITGCSEKDTIGIFSPAAGGANARGYYGALITGARVIMMEHFEPGDALRLIENEKITVAPLVPTQLIMMARHSQFGRYDLSSLRLILVTAASLPYDVAVECEEKFRCPIVQNYSSIDCSVGCIGSLSDPREIRLGTVGRPFAGARVRILDEHDRDVPEGEVGEVTLQGPAGASGYYRDPEATRKAWSKDGWFRMGDLGRLDQAGNLTLVGRKKEVIIRGGQNIYPIEIENLLANHPKVAAVAVVAASDPVMGERACACVVPRPGERFEFEDMISYLRGQGIAAFKLPERLEIFDRLPMVAGQKVDKQALKRDIIRG